MSKLEKSALPDVTSIRRTDDGRLSVFDALQVMGATSPRSMWSRLVEAYPEVVSKCDNLKFPGAGQRLTPVTDLVGWRRILTVLPGMMGRQYRAEANDLVDRYLAGDVKLAAELIDKQTDPAAARWLMRRAEHKHSSILLNSSLKRHGASQRGYRYVHDTLNVAVTGMPAQEIQLRRGNPVTKDNFTEQELAAHALMQFATINSLDDVNAVGDTDCVSAVETVTSDFRPSLRKYFGPRKYPQEGLLQADV
ncbi:hypothetical protein [Deinococcus ruber]|uniref:Uncharacterized protein n=1 Tax=Deinococcus ruber TaxID=1848197 RepID=A0A918CCT4_9DEIO|nr:hypothetical protein [Deinococcus ruber]GGR16504.1 hypothetical protein GCM10008957_31440 [Deinococcus ruber]